MATFSLRPLQEAIRNLKGIAPVKCDSEVQKGLLYSRGTLTASNTEMALCVASDVSMFNEEFIIPVKAFELLLTLQGDEVEMTAEKGRLNIKCGKLKNSFATHDVASYVFPSLDGEAGNAVTVDAEAFSEKLQAVLYAVDPAEKMPVMTGALIKTEAGKMVFVGLNNHQICIAEMPLSSASEATFSMIVPKKALTEFLKCKLKGQLTITPCGSKGVTLNGNGISLYARLIEGNFPDYQRLLEQIKDFPHTAECDRQELVATVRRVKACTNGEKTPVVFNINGSHANVTMSNQYSDYSEELDMPFEDSTSVRIGFNPKLLEQSLSGMAEEKVHIALASGAAPCVLRETGITSIVLPVNV